MLSEEKVMELLKRNVKTFAKTGSNKSLVAMFVLEKVLELSSKETDEMLIRELDKLEEQCYNYIIKIKEEDDGNNWL